MVEIIPAILSKTAADYHKKFKAVEPFTEWIQVDIVDNRFARNLTVGPKVVNSFLTAKKFEIQLMVDYIEDWIDPFVKARPARIIVPYESCRDPLGIIHHLRLHGILVGFSLNPETATSHLQHLIDKLDTVLLLSVHPGFSGQHFVFGTLRKIEELREMRPDIVIEVDGGIEPATARKCAEVGANILVAGSFIFENARMEGESYQDKVRRALDILKEDVEGASPTLEP